MATMPNKTEIWPDAFHPLDMNGMAGRMAVLPAAKGKTTEILFLYGQNSSLEQWLPLIEYLNRYGTVTAPDMPGFGGMDSFFSIGRRPTINAYADYLAAFFKFRFRRKQVVVVAVDFGFVAVTRMLQRYPQLARHVRRIVSINGCVRHDDVGSGAPRRRRLRRFAYHIGGAWLPSQLIRYAYLNRWMLPRLVAHSPAVTAQKTSELQVAAMARAIDLWRRGDIRTRFYTSSELLRFDNCARPLTPPLWHIRLADPIANHQATEQRLRVVFGDATFADSPVAPTDLLCLNAKLAAKLIDAKLRAQLSKS